jgi:hypothetical protein
VDASDVVQRVLPKQNLRAKQYFSRVVRKWYPARTKDVQILVIRVGEVVTLDYCPLELFMVNEIEAYLGLAASK